METINAQFKEKLKQLAGDAFGNSLLNVNIELTEDFDGDPQISIECVLKFAENLFPLSDTEMKKLARTSLDLKLKFINQFREHHEERSLYSRVSFAQEQKAA